MKENASTIILNEPMGDSARRLRFEVDWQEYAPGQFVMVAMPGGDAFLRRPFGIADLSGGSAEICVKVVGKGTRALARAVAGTELSVTGPCGKGFAPKTPGETAVLVAGGYGIGPLLGLCQGACKDVLLYYGARTKADFLYVDEILRRGVKTVFTTEDGSLGEKGLVSEALARDLDGIKNPSIFCCGPHGLLQAVARLGIERSVPTQASTEEYMACGIGVCMGCVCERHDGQYARTCRDGPVFEARELKWGLGIRD
jgi:dihydroorotate dehydrogenase electron transfer subunit